MSRPLVPRTLQGVPNVGTPPTIQRPRKISTACGACKQRKTRCSGGSPCEACTARSSQCIYDATSDQRRKIANQRNLQDLTEAQNDLEKHRQLLGGIIATIRAGDIQANHGLFQLIKSGVDLSQLAAHVRNECRSNYKIQQAYEDIDFIIDGDDYLPPTNLIISSSSSESPAGMVALQAQSLPPPPPLPPFPPPPAAPDFDSTGYGHDSFF